MKSLASIKTANELNQTQSSTQKNIELILLWVRNDKGVGCEQRAGVWFKNRRAKWRKQKREEQERLRKLQEERACGRTPLMARPPLSPAHSPAHAPPAPPTPRPYTDDSDSDLEVA
ncbi:hypothetical protein HF086_010230 [Spodoptera exigua]|uniref:Homeobox domain-containing protein n=1 Tax=Spodoptera exigua TaxID=7107 RepID=A0A922M8L9_SPOEX|nr:hypothetical protein HF086_010230 [Spodoptera exigua]